MPEKVKIYIENNFIDELKYFQKKYSYEIKILSDDKFIIPEYKIDLLNKSKKIVNSIENINKIILFDKSKSKFLKDGKGKNKEIIRNKETIKNKEKTKKIKAKKKVRTLWVRRKKKA